MLEICNHSLLFDQFTKQNTEFSENEMCSLGIPKCVIYNSWCVMCNPTLEFLIFLSTCNVNRAVILVYVTFSQTFDKATGHIYWTT